jgi:hypothetical protein
MRAALRTGGFPLALLLASIAGLAPASAAARPTRLPTSGKPKKKPTHAPICSRFPLAAVTDAVDVGPLTLKTSGALPGQPYGSSCTWTAQLPSEYVSTLTVTISPEPGFLGKRELEQGVASAHQAVAEGGRGGVVGHKNVPKGTVEWQLTQTSANDAPCTEEERQRGILPEQDVAACNPQPSSLGIFVEAYASPKPNVEPIFVLVSLDGEEGQPQLLGALLLVDQIFDGAIR